MRYISALLICLFLLSSAPVLGQSQPKFLQADQINAAVIVMPPPAADSRQTQSELAEVRRLIQQATPQRLEKAKYDDRTEELSVFTDSIGYEITSTSLPKTWQVLRDVRKEETVAVSAAKRLFKRPRPFEMDPAIAHCSSAEPNTSYPSGHANYIYATATVLAALLPDKAANIQKRADEFAESRLICGMHFRSDIVAGKLFGTHIGASLLKNSAFKSSFDGAFAELHNAIK